jgi:hypothetical protein
MTHVKKREKLRWGPEMSVLSLTPQFPGLLTLGPCILLPGCKSDTVKRIFALLN